MPHQKSGKNSLSLATGIPRETIRRKVSELKTLGWITNDKKTGLRITPKCVTHFAPDFSLKVLDQMLGVAGILRDLLGSAISEQPALTKTHTSETTSLPKSVKGSKNVKRAPQSPSS
jgi:DNA-binding GntR family transcriptional regulator